jgi:hypothetical protein
MLLVSTAPNPERSKHFASTDLKRNPQANARSGISGARRLTIEAWDALKASKGSVVFITRSAAFDPKP